MAKSYHAWAIRLSTGLLLVEDSDHEQVPVIFNSREAALKYKYWMPGDEVVEVEIKVK